MKTIKFRVLDKRDGTNIIRGMDYIYVFLEQGGKFDDGQLLWMQFTGLLDKNGKEIYENDYLSGGIGLNTWCVFWRNGKYILQNISTGDIIDCNEKNTQGQEVIGNRYENPREHKAMASDL